MRDDDARTDFFYLVLQTEQSNPARLNAEEFYKGMYGVQYGRGQKIEDVDSAEVLSLLFSAIKNKSDKNKGNGIQIINIEIVYDDGDHIMVMVGYGVVAGVRNLNFSDILNTRQIIYLDGDEPANIFLIETDLAYGVEEKDLGYLEGKGEAY